MCDAYLQFDQCLDDVPQEVLDALAGLRYNSLIAVMLGLDVADLCGYTAVYFSDPDIKFHRVGVPVIFSRHNVPDGKSSLVAEITANEGDDTWELSDNQIVRRVVKGLHERGMISEETICYANVRRSRYASVVYDLQYLQDIQVIRDYVANLGIELCGRFAEFEYLNMDACVDRGVRLAHRLNG